MSRLIFIRNGQSDRDAKNGTLHHDSELSLLGAEQAYQAAQAVASLITPEEWTGYVSPYYRCLMMALPIMDQTGIPFAVNASLGTRAEGLSAMVYSKSGIHSEFAWEETVWTRSSGLGWNYVDYVDYDNSDESHKRNIEKALNLLEGNRIIVSHREVIKDLVKQTCGANIEPSLGSVTLVEEGKLVIANLVP